MGFHPSASPHLGDLSGGAHTDHTRGVLCPSHRTYLPHSHMLSSSQFDPTQSQTGSLQARSRVLYHIFLIHCFPCIMSASSHDANWGARGGCKPCSWTPRTTILTRGLIQRDVNTSLEYLVLSQEGDKKGPHFFLLLFPLSLPHPHPKITRLPQMISSQY